MTYSCRPPLAGCQVVVTRRAEDAAALVQQLQALGAAVTLLPCISVRPMPVDVDLVAGLAHLAHASHIAFASRQGVFSLASVLSTADWPIAADVHVVGVGPATAAAAQNLLRRPVAVCQPHTAEGLAAYLLTHTRNGRSHVILPGARQGRTVVAQALRAAGVQITCLHLYETTVAKRQAHTLALPARVDYVLFTSPSTVRGFVAQARLPEGAKTVSLGPTTSQALRQYDLPVHQQASVHTLEGLVAAIVEMEQR